jgi:hypothetical protein
MAAFIPGASPPLVKTPIFFRSEELNVGIDDEYGSFFR